MNVRKTCIEGRYLYTVAEKGVSTESICVRNGDINLERKHSSMKYNEPDCNGAFVQISTVWPQKDQALSQSEKMPPKDTGPTFQVPS